MTLRPFKDVSFSPIELLTFLLTSPKATYLTLTLACFSSLELKAKKKKKHMFMLLHNSIAFQNSPVAFDRILVTKTGVGRF